MRLAIADASDGIYDSAVFIQAGSLVSNENPVADLSLQPQSAADPSAVTAIVEAEDPNGLALTYTINWGDGTSSSGPLNSPTNESEKTTTASHVYGASGNYLITLTVSNGALVGTSVEDVHIGTGGVTAMQPAVTTNPADQVVNEGDWFTFTAAATGNPAPSIQWQISTDFGNTFADIPGATQTTYTAMASLADDGTLYQAVFTNDEGDAVTTAALLNVLPVVPADATPPAAPLVALTSDSGVSDTDNITSVGYLAIGGIEDGATVEYSVDGGSNWSLDFTASEGQNSVQVRQTDQAGNVSDAALLDFLLDTQNPVALDLALLADTGNSSSDLLTNNGALVVKGAEADAQIEYSTDGGTTWSTSFVAQEGLNTVQVRQTDVAGNTSSVSALSFTLDTTAPAKPAVALQQDTGLSATDNITKLGSLNVAGAEANAKVEYSSDGGVTWTTSFMAKEGMNNVGVRQVDLAGNVSAVSSLTFRLDTTAPQLSPSFSSGTLPILVNAKGVTVSPNATDEGGVASQTAGTVATATAGKKSLICTATDLAGNTTAVTVSYTVGYAAVNVTPQAGATYKKTSTLSGSFQLKDANGLVADNVASNLAGKVTVTIGNQTFDNVSYNKAAKTFKFSVKLNNFSAGSYSLGVHVFASGSEVMTVNTPIKIV